MGGGGGNLRQRFLDLGTMGVQWENLAWECDFLQREENDTACAISLRHSPVVVVLAFLTRGAGGVVWDVILIGVGAK